MLRPIVRYGARGLHAPAAPVDDVRRRHCTQLIDDMIETMYAAPGHRPGGAAGRRAAAHLRHRLSASASAAASSSRSSIPEFVERDGMQLEEEGCLSVPGLQRHRRAAGARGRAAGSIATASRSTIEGTGLLARALQHEIDHLDGTLFVDRLRGIKRDLIVRKIRSSQRAGKW